MMAVDGSRHLWSARVDPRRRIYAAVLDTHARDRSGPFYDQPVVLNERQVGVAVEGVECTTVPRTGFASLRWPSSDRCGRSGMSRLILRLRGCVARRCAIPPGQCTIWANIDSQTVPTMSTTSTAHKPIRKASTRSLAADIVIRDPKQFWLIEFKRHNASQQSSRKAFHELVDRVRASPGIVLYDAVESGVPTYMVDVIAGATGEAATHVMDVIGVSQTTYRRKDEAREPLPDAAGHRVMGFLRVMATLRRLLEESGDQRQLAEFDLDTWVAGWMREPLPELGNKTPAEMLRNPEGQRAVELVLERMRGGLPA
jgi:putative toxin-antitoxin system antitoxin component (TIGR02293 family)